MYSAELQKVSYVDRGTALNGWLVRPRGIPRAAIAVFPTIMNLTPAVARRAQMLEESGFVALIADLYGETPTTFDGAVKLAASLRADVDHYRTRIGAALATLRSRPETNGLRLGAIGYCLGGQAALEAARVGEELDLVVSFHGTLETGRRATAGGPFYPRILVCHGDADPLVPRAQLIEFLQELDAAAARWHLHSYGRVRHGFTDSGSDTNPMEALGYDASADRQSWAGFLSLADEVFGEGTI